MDKTRTETWTRHGTKITKSLIGRLLTKMHLSPANSTFTPEESLKLWKPVLSELLVLVAAALSPSYAL